MPVHSIMAVRPSSIILNLASVRSSAMWMAVLVCNVTGNVHRNRLTPRANAMKIISWSCTCESTQLRLLIHWTSSFATFPPLSNGLSLREPSAEAPNVQFVVVSYPILNKFKLKNIIESVRGTRRFSSTINSNYWKVLVHNSGCIVPSHFSAFFVRFNINWFVYLRSFKFILCSFYHFIS